MKTLDIVAATESLAVARFPQKGRGVVALRAFAAGSLVERAPVIVAPDHDVARIAATTFGRYYYEWGEDDNQAAIVLGYGSLYNHSYAPNLEFEFREDEQVVEFVARCAIEPGDELTVNYNNLGEYENDPLSFEVR